MKEIVYGIYSEDEALKLFMFKALPKLVDYYGKTEQIFFKHQRDFNLLTDGHSKEKTIKNCKNAVKIGIAYFNLELCFIGVDADNDDHQKLFDQLHKKFKDTNLEQKVLIYIPVKYIEHWLWYIKQKMEHPELQSKPYFSDEQQYIEVCGLKSKQVKNIVYNGHPRQWQKMIKDWMKAFDVAWLKQCSNSFAHFCNELEQYLNRL